MDIQESENKNKQEKDSNKLIFAENLLFFRKKLNISQKELAEKLQVSNKNISKWENAETIPDVFTIKKLANIFNVSIDTLVSPIPKENQIAIKTQKVIPNKWKIYIICLVNAIIFLASCITFFTLESLNIESFNSSFIFIYMLPVMALSIFIFICIVYKKADAISLSIFGWLLTFCFYISFKDVENIIYIFNYTLN